MTWLNINAAVLTVCVCLSLTMYLLGATAGMSIYAGTMLFVIGMLAKYFLPKEKDDAKK
jgi:hypothetical protein